MDNFSVKILDQVKCDLASIPVEASTEVLRQLGDLTSDYLEKKLSNKFFNALGKSLSIDSLILERCLGALARLYFMLIRSPDKEEEIWMELEVALPVGFIPIIRDSYKKQERPLRSAIQSAICLGPQYRSLEWRLETELASRSLNLSLTPRVILKLDLVNNGKIESTALSSDIPNIVHWSQMVDQALAEARSQASRKIQRLGHNYNK